MSRTAHLLVLLLLAPATCPAQPPCPGDCDADGAARQVELEEALKLVFDAANVPSCAGADRDGSGEIAVAEILLAVTARAELPEGCIAPVPIARWRALEPLVMGGRQEVGSVALDRAIYVIGGFDDRGRGTTVVERYDVDEDRWTTLAALPNALQHVGAAAAEGQVYSIGGFVGSTFVPTEEVYRYDPDLDEWSALAPLPEPRGALAAVSLRGRIHALGGSTFVGSVATHTMYDPGTGMWTQLAPFPGNGRNHLAAVVLGQEICVVGGRPGEDGGNSDALACWDPDTNDWQGRAPMPTARSGHGAAVIGGRLVALGGEVSASDPGGVFPHVEVYDPRADAWVRLEDMPVPRHGLGVVAISSRLYAPGGATLAGFGASARHDVLEFEF